MPNVGSEELGRKMAGHGGEGALAAARQVWAAPQRAAFLARGCCSFAAYSRTLQHGPRSPL